MTIFAAEIDVSLFVFDSMISVFNGNSEQMTLGVASHQFDLAILNNPPIINDKSIFYTKRLLRSQVVLAGSSQFVHLKGKPLSYYNIVPFTDTVVRKNMAISGNRVIPIMKEAIKTYVANNQLF